MDFVFDVLNVIKVAGRANKSVNLKFLMICNDIIC